jgi:hypothetical protein
MPDFRKISRMSYEEMLNMELNQIKSSPAGDIIRVPGGWLYVIKTPAGSKTIYQNPVFMPFPKGDL